MTTIATRQKVYRTKFCRLRNGQVYGDTNIKIKVNQRYRYASNISGPRVIAVGPNGFAVTKVSNFELQKQR